MVLTTDAPKIQFLVLFKNGALNNSNPPKFEVKHSNNITFDPESIKNIEIKFVYLSNHSVNKSLDLNSWLIIIIAAIKLN
ncbi:19241_t:CDS:1, partial [Gigaspora rosea]